MDQRLSVLHRLGGEKGVNLAEMHKDDTMITNWLAREDSRFAVERNNSRSHRFLSHNIIRGRIKGS